MAAVTSPHVQMPAPPPPSDFVPPLETGDRLSQAEFHRRYSAMPEVKKAELVEGVVYMASPVSIDNHADPHGVIVGWLSLYRFRTPGVRLADNGTVVLDDLNEVQPDAALFIQAECGGQSKVETVGLSGAPELAAEVAASSVSYDLHDKLRAYQRQGVREYIVWRTLDRQVDWFVLREGKFVRADSADGIQRSSVFPGLYLNVAALVGSDFEKLESTLREGLASPEHGAFVERLAANSKPKEG
ncbi:MAG: Uma2 family endonuclease [Gemmataceae bacterium]|nr:Uma2 family endonuclease [Gemmataceae bacterium]